MPNKYDNIQQLIGYWQQFEVQSNDNSMEEFGRWLVRNSENTNNRHPLIQRPKGSSKGKGTDETAEADFRQNFVMQITRLSKCQDFYAKKFFNGLPINTLLEYNFLFSLNKSEVLKKMDIINLNMVEYTTGVDILKRLNKLNLVSEFRDVMDKRNKRIKITSEGKRVLLEAMLRMNKLYELFLCCISDKEWLSIADALTGLNEFHNKIFIQYNDKSYFEIIQLTNRIKSEPYQVIYKNSNRIE